MNSDGLEADLPLVSVIMPAYNHERFVEEAVRSVWQQTYPNVELIVLDDGSRDATPRILKRLLEESPIPMQVVCKANEGLTRTLNRGLGLARGEYVALSSGDDRYLPHHVETLVSAAREERPGTLVHGDVYMIDENGARTGARLSDESRFRSGMVFEDLLLFRLTIPGLAALVPADAFAEAGGYNEASLIDDWEIFLRITRSRPVRYLPEGLAEYRSHGQGQLTRRMGELVPDLLRIFEDSVRGFPGARDRVWLRRARSRLYARIGLSFYVIRDFAQARRWLVRSLAQWPVQRQSIAVLARTLLGARLIERISSARALRQKEKTAERGSALKSSDPIPKAR